MYSSNDNSFNEHKAAELTVKTRNSNYQNKTAQRPRKNNNLVGPYMMNSETMMSETAASKNAGQYMTDVLSSKNDVTPFMDKTGADIMNSSSMVSNGMPMG